MALRPRLRLGKVSARPDVLVACRRWCGAFHGGLSVDAETGISEFNPELMEEMARLRLANEQLTAKVCTNALTRLRLALILL